MDFKIGDRVIVEKTNVPYDCKGKIGTIVEGPRGVTYKWNVAFDDGLKLWCDVKCLVEDTKKQNKIVITHDGKTTTATLYREDGTKEVATAKCCPEDTFDFNVGAKLAMERLMKKVEPVEEWRVVDREPRVGDYIRLKCVDYTFDEIGNILKVDVVKDHGLVAIYEKNHPYCPYKENPNFHWNYDASEYEVVEKVTTTEPKKPEFGNVNFKTGDYAKIIARKWGHGFEIGTIVKLEKCEYNYRATADGMSWKVLDDELEAYTPPKYYNGRAVCTENRNRYPGFTVGKIYNVVDGKFIDDNGKQRPMTNDRVKDFNEPYFKGWAYKFIPIVE